VLKPGGVFICSTPNISYTFHPAFHLHEFSADEYFNVIQEHIGDHERFGQYFRRIDRLRDLYLRKLLPGEVSGLIRFVAYVVRSAFGADASSRVVLGLHRDAIAQNLSVDIAGWLDATVNREEDSVYGVVPYHGEKMCRIMIVVARL
jgi:hypothetical protein